MRRLFRLGWLASHLLMVALVAGMLGLAGWQLSRAAGGNMLSWGYTIQWPVFAGFVIYIWWREVRRVLGGEDLLRRPAPAPQPSAARLAVAYDDSDDPELAAYNRYLAWLNANPGARRVDYPG